MYTWGRNVRLGYLPQTHISSHHIHFTLAGRRGAFGRQVGLVRGAALAPERVWADAAKAVKTNDALIRNQLVGLFTQQTSETLGSVEAKEKLRQEALKQIQQVMTAETGKPMVDDLLFNNLIVQ